MIYRLPPLEDAIDQGDIFEDCPVPVLISVKVDDSSVPQVKAVRQRIIVLTQTCDLAN